jgi:hypothetical protein
MRILSTPILVVKLHRCAENRARFPNELLSLEQNKDAPFLTKEMIDWTFSESSGRTESHGVITDPPPLFFSLVYRDHWSIDPHGSRDFARFGKFACQTSTCVLPNLWPRSAPGRCDPVQPPFA